MSYKERKRQYKCSIIFVNEALMYWLLRFLWHTKHITLYAISWHIIWHICFLIIPVSLSISLCVFRWRSYYCLQLSTSKQEKGKNSNYRNVSLHFISWITWRINIYLWFVFIFSTKVYCDWLLLALEYFLLIFRILTDSVEELENRNCNSPGFV